ncbi:GNAT family N-acetyltransferase [Plantactinospora sp. GCM10030261]|uniref:GNAT family N-acetyltransferase n=1 Tax=Plantactinospora sp. GCM10030261 TaxID=3273420 RepID=UPI00360A5872
MALWRIRATVDDRPGYLSVLTASLALRSVNILSVQVHTTEAGAVDDFLVDAPEKLSGNDLVAAVERGRGRDCWVARGEARVLADPPTRALGLAGRLVRDPDRLGEALRTLLDASTVTWRPSGVPASSGVPADPAPTATGLPAEPVPVSRTVPVPVPEADPRPRRGFSGESMWLADPAGGSFEVTRVAPGFTPAEYARAQALIDVAAALAERDVDQVTVLLPDGTEVIVRPATEDDLPAALAMHSRCSVRSLRRRYLTAGPPSEAQVSRLLLPSAGLTLVATVESTPTDRPRLVAIGSLIAEGDLAAAALLVEDAWQRRGIGTALLRRLVTHARRAGYAALVGHAVPDDDISLRVLHRVVPDGRTDREDDLLTVAVPLTPESPATPDSPPPLDSRNVPTRRP